MIDREKYLKINNIAYRCFLEVADQDYLAARSCYRYHLLHQFLWSGLHSIEKYIKCILLLNRIDSRPMGHDLSTGLTLMQGLPFKVDLDEKDIEFIGFLNDFGAFRYLEGSWHADWVDLPRLDKVVWTIRRFCAKLDPLNKDDLSQDLDKFKDALKRIENSKKELPTKFRLPGGYLEKVLENKDHPAREILIWKNFYYGIRHKEKILLKNQFRSENSPLTMFPDVLDNVSELIRIPKKLIDKYTENCE